MHLFFQGASGIGKSSLLRKKLLPYEKILGGFIVQRLMKDGQRIGFRAITLEGAYPELEAVYKRDYSGVFMLQGNTNLSILKDVLAKAEKEINARKCKLIVLDEIGGIELLSPDFMKMLNRILQTEIPCIGILKSKENLAHMISKLKLKNSYFELHSTLQKTILLRGKIITVNQKECALMLKHIEDFLHITCCSKTNLHTNIVAK